MKTNITLLGLLIVFFSSCSTPKYLPSSSQIDVNEYGSYIKISHQTAPQIDGELIAIDSNSIVVLIEDSKRCTTIAVSDVKHFKLRYAKPKHYGSCIPAFLVYPIIHGFFSVLTMPLHLIVTISVTVSGENAFMYSDKKMTYDKLRMFARFPQGIPSNVDLESIK